MRASFERREIVRRGGPQRSIKISIFTIMSCGLLQCMPQG